ncbi:Heat shock protein, Hsp 70 family and DUF3731 [Desulfonema limicola]|uniref:Heat shock protein, Hsp 70 family and DUF3731 n=1 Tax=Desulfonema limicola TaxID=45656 RepID=A0A975BA26_9BACT|nr:Hsp70 family protein [Desulfonema limicola]QTA81558.1 Heat shock protein, Hsp 70 family and DUF3731 [Desulfonema limicola]
MDPLDKKYIIGIDLGTTNSAVSYVDLQDKDNKNSRIKIFRVPQLTGAGEFSTLSVLPSFLYIPGEYDISKTALTIPWGTQDDIFVGAFARDHGSKVSSRLVSSAKSWLCHSNADRRSKILPWGAGDEVVKISPVQATAYYLKHIKNAWNNAIGDDGDLYLENQLITITVPASFDEVARDLTLEAAAIAGLNNVTLLEEPLAAFYSWLINHEKKWNQFVNPGELILVCDVGGGTTDFTLITLKLVDGSPRFERIAVGDHLILGGDNVDLALARRVEMRMSKKGKKVSLSTDRWKSLCHQCRQAKEMILDGLAESKKITLMGKGKKLIAGTLAASLDRKEIEGIVLEGFFPIADPDLKKKKDVRKGITEFGLPYESEPAITQHMGWFLEHHREDVKQELGRDNPAPDLILFNGGSLKSPVIQEQIRAAVRHWFKIDDNNLPRVLENNNPDLAVALGAAYYGLVKIGHGVRVGSGSPRSYYLGVVTSESQNKESETIDNTNSSKKAICLVERGLDEGTRIELKHSNFEVLANQPVSFDIYSSSFRSGDNSGDIINIDDTLTILPPIKTIVQFGKKETKKTIPVKIEAQYTEMGTLALWCCSAVSRHCWQLQFQLRETETRTEIPYEDIIDTALVDQVCLKLKDVLLNNKDDLLDTLVKDISALAGQPRDKWPLGLIRSMADELLKHISVRKIKANYESRWLNLAGYCMRPGFGDGFDEHRIKKLWKIYKNGPVYSNNAQVRSEWWIMWRRVAGGLKPGQQRQFIQDITSLMFSKKGGKSKISPQEKVEIWMAVANMEYLLVKDKITWGRQLLAEISSQKSSARNVWSISRLGARELLYGPVDRVIPPAEAAAWIKKLMNKEWKNPKPICSAIAQMARKTGDRMRDIEPEFIPEIIEYLSQYDFTESAIHFLQNIVPLEKKEESAIFGESLPSGIVLKS